MLCVAAVLGAGCPTSGDGGDATLDLGPARDLGPRPGADTDGDGLCDLTEIRLGTDPTKADTDGDGYPDWHETSNRSDAASGSEPPPADLSTLVESPTSTVSWGTTARVSGSGATYFPDFLAALSDDPFGTTASAFYVGTRALDASPRDNVGRIDTATGQFQGVVGTTQLFFVSDFAYGTVPTRGCLRLYSFYVRVKTDTGSYVAAKKGYLLVGPAGASPLTGPWCDPPSPCQ